MVAEGGNQEVHYYRSQERGVSKTVEVLGHTPWCKEGRGDINRYKQFDLELRKQPEEKPI